MLSAIETDCQSKGKFLPERHSNWFLQHMKKVRQRIEVADEDMGNNSILENSKEFRMNVGIRVKRKSGNRRG